MGKLSNLQKDNILNSSQAIIFQFFKDSEINDIGQKMSISSKIMSDVTNILNSENPILSNRQNLLNILKKLASIYPLINQEQPVFLNTKGGLIVYADKLAEKYTEIKEFMDLANKIDNSESSLDEVLKGFLGINGLMALVYNNIRVELGDYNQEIEKDWFVFCYTSLVISQEYTYREVLGLPSLTTGDITQKIVAHDFWSDILLDNNKDPLFTWNKIWEEYVGEDSPYILK